MLKVTKVGSTATVIAGDVFNTISLYKMRVRSVHLCNDTVSAETIQVYIVPKDGTATDGADGNKISADKALASKEEGVLDVSEVILEGGETIQAIGTTGDLVNAVVSYEVVEK